MIDLTKTTLIIPLYIESEDRYNNAVSVLGFLNHHFKTNVIIHEIINGESRLPKLDDYNNLNITYLSEPYNQGIYHRTRQLNEMLNIVETPVVVNYDIDVLLPVESYLKAQNLILDGKHDVVYPYGESNNGQVRIFQKFNRNQFDKNFDLGLLGADDYDLWSSKCGHCIFLDTEKYISCGGENEEFIAYGPEDSERYERFYKVGYNVGRIKSIVYHFEHSRTPLSSNQNKYFKRNKELYDILSRMSKNEIVEHYSEIKYKEKYNRFKNED
jgi:predicted glycosyltransferase involved in capsule biosynthesis